MGTNGNPGFRRNDVSDVLRTRTQTPPRILFATAGLAMAGVLGAGFGAQGLVLAPVVLVAAYALAGSVVAAGIAMLVSAVAGAAALGMWAFVPPELVGYTAAARLVLPAALVLTLTQVSPVVRRFRAERRGGRTVAVAVDVATSTAGRPGLVAGAAMTASLTGLALGAAGELSTLATAALLATIAALVVVTLVQPALLTRLGGLDLTSTGAKRRVTHLRATVVATGVALRHPASVLTLTAVTAAAALVFAVRMLPFGPVAGAVVLAAAPLAGQFVLLLDRVNAATRAGMTWHNAVIGGTREAAGTITASAAVTAGLLALLVPGVTGSAAAAFVVIASAATVFAVPSLLLVVRAGGSVAGQPAVSRPEHHGC